ncbi:glycosyltransferase family 4 protein [Qipengyuania sp. 6B39]|uniref:glycosyltransferase family 4 protein n=1 Tax=Qipengyuania proteolytica TaxID=2867239 RepID=UPI001C8AEA06|nr:glycosyltransferase family 4 protein [Qipengyuania proteolytica]MBX7495823.1 glycosyltransferase family 4 protein [Qipengyuania proteolytica]
MTTEDRTTICVAFAGDRLGGSHISLKGLLDRLPQSQYRVIVILEVPGGRTAEFFGGYEQFVDPGALEKPFAVGRSFGVASLLRTLPSVASRTRLLKELGADIVHTNDGRSHASWALAAKLAGAKMVWHHRGDPDAKGTSYVAPLLADQIVSVSQYSLPTRRWGKLNEARVIHSPFDVEIDVDRAAMRQTLIQELQCPADTVLCAYVGQFIERKRPDRFIDAVIEMERQSPRPVLGLLFGEAKDEAVSARMQQRLDAYPGDAPVRLMGYREPGHSWIAGCDVLLVPALNEPLGRTLVEAMLVGTPVVAVRSGGNAEALTPDCGILVPPDDPYSMAAAALSLLSSQTECASLTQRARVMARRRYTSERHVEQMREVYTRLAGGPRASSPLKSTA